MKISIIAPAFNEESTIPVFVDQVKKTLVPKFDKLELILVDDGSTDKTWEVIQSFAAKEPWVIGTRLSRNFGHQVAVLAGLHKSQNDLVAIIDVDMQDPPHLIYEMALMVNNEVDIVYGKRLQRVGETWFKKVTAKAFYRIMNKTTEFDLPLDTGDFRVVSRRALNFILSVRDNRPFIRGYFAYSGFKAIPFSYIREERVSGESKYPLNKMLKFTLSAFLAFSAAPFNIALYLAAFIGFFSPIFLLIYLLYQNFSINSLVVGFLGMILAIVSSFMLSLLFIIGKYVEGIHIMTRNLPAYLEVPSPSD